MENFIGEIRMFAGDFAPDGWCLCDGSELSIGENPALFALLGITYGGDGVMKFRVPDLRGRVPVGQGLGTGLTRRVMGQYFGAETATISLTGCPPHNHKLLASSEGVVTGTPGKEVVLAKTSPQVPLYDAKTNRKPLDQRAIGVAGGNQPHANVMPSSCINFIIATSGEFPSNP